MLHDDFDTQVQPEESGVDAQRYADEQEWQALESEWDGVINVEN